MRYSNIESHITHFSQSEQCSGAAWLRLIERYCWATCAELQHTLLHCAWKGELISLFTRVLCSHHSGTEPEVINTSDYCRVTWPQCTQSQILAGVSVFFFGQPEWSIWKHRVGNHTSKRSSWAKRRGQFWMCLLLLPLFGQSGIRSTTGSV